MTIKQGFLFLFLAITGWISLCYLVDKAFPKEQPVYMSYWYGEVHFGVPEYEWPDVNDPSPADEGSEEKEAE